GQRRRAAARRLRRHGVRLRRGRHRRPDDEPDPGRGYRLSQILPVILARTDTGPVMRIDIHSHLMSVAFLEHLQGRDTLPTAVRDAKGFTAHCTPQLSLPYRAPILDVGAKLAGMDAAGIDLAVLSHGLPGPHVLGGAEADTWAA